MNNIFNVFFLQKFTKKYIEKQWSHKLPVEISGISSKEIMFNPLEFSIIIDNIADNAQKANSTKLTIYFGNDNDGFYINWTDDGYGLQIENDNNKVFEQGYTTTNGTGIGLYTVKKYVDNMNATISINEKYKDGFELQMRF